jgi:hypothetical protein
MKFTSVQQVLDFIGTEYEGEKCDAITALQAAVFHQQNQKDGKDPKVLEGKDAKNGKDPKHGKVPKFGQVLLSKNIGLELFTKALPNTREIEGTKYTAIPEVMMFAFPVLCERLLASALYMMKDPREAFPFESTAVGAMQSWGEITKLSILDNSADSHKIEFEYTPNRYTAFFYKEEGFFCFRICQLSEVVNRGD